MHEAADGCKRMKIIPSTQYYNNVTWCIGNQLSLASAWFSLDDEKASLNFRENKDSFIKEISTKRGIVYFYFLYVKKTGQRLQTLYKVH